MPDPDLDEDLQDDSDLVDEDPPPDDEDDASGENDPDLVHDGPPDAGAVDEDLDESVDEPAGNVIGAGLFDPDADEEVDAGDREWPVLLLEGRRVRGPFRKPAPDGGPMLEVWEILRTPGRRGVKPGAYLGRVPHDADEEDLERECGAGPRFLSIRAPSGRVLAQHSVSIAKRSAPAREAPPPAPAHSGGELAQVLALFAKQNEGMMQAVTKGLEAISTSNQQLQDRLLAAEQARNKEELELLRKMHGKGGGGGRVRSELEVLEDADKIRERFAKVLGKHHVAEEEQGDLLDEVMEEFGKLADSASKAKGLVDLLKD